MKKLYCLIILVLIFNASNLFSQISVKTERKFPGKWFSKPTIDFSYGLNETKLSGFNTGIAQTGSLELKLGFTYLNNSKYGKNILKYRDGFIFLSNSSNSLYNNSDVNKINSSMWRFGFGSKSAYGIKLGSVSIIPYNSNSFVWSEFKYDTLNVNSSVDYSALNEFSNSFRYGSVSEAGINFQITPGFSIQPKFEISDIYPRHLFWKQSVSTMIEFSGLFLIESFSKRIMKSSPVAGTFVNFILTNAYEYGFYQLRKENVRWPYSGGVPLYVSTFKLGMTFTF